MTDACPYSSRTAKRSAGGFLLLASIVALSMACQDDAVSAGGADAVVLDQGATDGPLDVPTPRDFGSNADSAGNSADAVPDSPADSGTDRDDDPAPNADAMLDPDAEEVAIDAETDQDGDLTDEDAGLPDVTPLQCSGDVDPCPDGFNCFCGGPGPISNCFCGRACDSAQDCQEPARPVCCGDTCTSSCECFCD